MLVLFEIYIRKLIIRVKVDFGCFINAMNGINDDHIFVWRAYKVCIGYSIHTFHEKPKINFQFLNERKPLDLIFFTELPL